MRRIAIPIVFTLPLVGAAEPRQQILANGRPVPAEAGDDSDFAHLLAELGDARVVHLVGDAPQAQVELDRARGKLIRFLSSEAGFEVLVLPAGIFEGVVTDARLRQGAEPARAAELLYRVWRESESFLEMLGSVPDEMEIIGGLCRFHATGKALYTPHLLRFFDEARPDLLGPDLRGEIERLWSGRGRLSRASAEMRSDAFALADRVLARFDEVRAELTGHHGTRRVDLERHILVNMRTFVELEEARAGDSPRAADLDVWEKRQNLEWFLNERFPTGKIVYWEGRGDSVEPLPTQQAVFTIQLESSALTTE